MMMSNGSSSSKSNGEMNGHSSLKPLGGFQWLAWDSEFIQKKMPDPTRMFSILVCTIVCFRFLERSNWDVPKMIFGFFLNPFVLVFSSFACWIFYRGLTQAAATRHCSLLDAWQSLPIFDRWTAEWYWWNAWLYHGVMDGASGTLQAVPVVLSQYRVMDRRFSNDHSVPWAVGLVEILIMQPVCLWTMYSVLTNSPNRFPLELIASTLHIFGAILFVITEVYEGQFNIPALDPVGVPGNRFGNVKLFSEHQYLYYWFGFWFCNLVWVWVPLLRIQRAFAECVRSFRIGAAQQHQNGAATKKVF